MSDLRKRAQKAGMLLVGHRKTKRGWFRYVFDPNRCSHSELQKWQRFRAQHAHGLYFSRFR